MSRRRLKRAIVENGGRIPRPLLTKARARSRVSYRGRRRITNVTGSLVGGIVLWFGGGFLIGAIVNENRENAARTAASVASALFAAQETYYEKKGTYTSDLDALKKESGSIGVSKTLDTYDGKGSTHKGLIVLTVEDRGQVFRATINDSSMSGPGDLVSERHPGVSFRRGDRIARGCTAESVVSCVNGTWDPRLAVSG